MCKPASLFTPKYLFLKRYLKGYAQGKCPVRNNVKIDKSKAEKTRLKSESGLSASAFASTSGKNGGVFKLYNGALTLAAGVNSYWQEIAEA